VLIGHDLATDGANSGGKNGRLTAFFDETEGRETRGRARPARVMSSGLDDPTGCEDLVDEIGWRTEAND
jgi:hypothetical protein